MKINTFSIIFSFYNEEDLLTELLERTRLVLQDLKNQALISNYEFVFVNDASTDDSLDVLLKEARRHHDICIVNTSRRFGISPSVMAGLAYASGDAVLYMDADLQDPPELIPELIKTMLEKNADVVHTVRRSRKGESFFKLFITRIGYLILNRVSDLKLPVEAGDFKLLSRRVVQNLLRLKETRPFVRGMICWIGFKQEFVSYDRDARKGGKTKCPVISSVVINNFFNSALISFSSAPLRISTFFGLIAIVFDLILVVHVCLEKFSGKAIPGWTAIMIAILFLCGVQLFCTGIMGLYLHAVYEQSKERPNYIIDSVLNFSRNSLPLTPGREENPMNRAIKTEIT